MLVLTRCQRKLLAGSFSAALLFACEKPPERPGSASASATAAEPREDPRAAARCQEELKVVEPRLAEWRQDITKADAEELADLFEDCRGKLSPTLLSTLQHWESVEFEAAGERGGAAWDILFAHARLGPQSTATLQLFGRLGRQAVKRVDTEVSSNDWRRRATWAFARVIDSRSTPAEITYAAGVIRAFALEGKSESADLELLADKLAQCATLLPAADNAGLLCTLESARYYKLLSWQCARCSELALQQYRAVLRRKVGNPEYKEAYASMVPLLVKLKQFPDAKRLVEKLSQDPEFLKQERDRRAHLRPLPTQQEFIDSMRSWIPYKEALDFHARGQYARCAQQLSTLTHDDELRSVRPELLLLLGDCYEATGARAQADQAWRDAVAYSPALEIDVQQRQQQRRTAKQP